MSVSFVYIFFFFKQKTAYEMRISDWSSDVCSSDLTDGVTEAFNHDNEAYGSERLLAMAAPGHGALEHCRRLVAEVHRFADGAPQSDDITVLAIRLGEDSAVDAEAQHQTGAVPC